MRDRIARLRARFHYLSLLWRAREAAGGCESCRALERAWPLPSMSEGPYTLFFCDEASPEDSPFLLVRRSGEC